MNLRCPECMSEVTRPDDPAGDLRCENCGERFGRAEAMVSVADAESYAEDLAGRRCACGHPSGAERRRHGVEDDR